MISGQGGVIVSEGGRGVSECMRGQGNVKVWRYEELQWQDIGHFVEYIYIYIYGEEGVHVVSGRVRSEGTHIYGDRLVLGESKERRGWW